MEQVAYNESFNNDWMFRKDKSLQKVCIDLPHDAMILEERDPDCDNAHNSGFYPGGKYYYEKDWFVPEDFRGKRIFLVFDGIYHNSTVFINGLKAAEQPYGYSPFTVNCESFLDFGGPNRILIEVDNSKTPNGRWYTGSGIYRSVSLIVKEEEHIEINGVKIKTLSIAPPRISVKTKHSGIRADIEILQKGTTLARAAGDDVEIDLPEAGLWSDETPELCQCRVSVLGSNGIIDHEEIDFGIRKLEWSTEGLKLNGKIIKLRGACIHHDNGILGACAFKDAEERKIRLLKEAGFNAVRSSHNPCSEYLLQAADRHGMLVMDEFSDVWYKAKQKNDYSVVFDEWYHRDLKAMVERDFNHPSVIMYSIGNEIGEVYEDRGIELTAEMASLCREIDDTRPVTIGTNLAICKMAAGGSKAFKATDTKKKKAKRKKKSKKLVGSELYNVLINIIGSKMDKASADKKCDSLTAPHFEKVDICGYNYGTIRYAGEKALHPDRIIVGSETRPPNICKNWRETLTHDYVIGDFMWTGWDYIGEAGLSAVTYSASRRSGGILLKKYPFMLSGAGVIDICGYFLPEVWLNRAVWGIIGDSPCIGVEPVIYSGEKAVYSMWRKTDAVRSWSWHGYEGGKAKVIVYSNAAMVELMLNGKSLGMQPVVECTARFKTKYMPGELTAINYDSNGNETGRNCLATAGALSLINLKPDKTELRSNGQDLCFLDISLTDGAGEIIPSVDRPLQIKITGPGRLQGFGSASPFTEEGFNSNTHTSHYGRAQAVIRTGRETGEIMVSVSAPGLETQSIKINVIESGRIS